MTGALDITFGEPFGKYRLLGAMTPGGMAEVFVALMSGIEGFSKVVALKRVLPNLAESDQFIEMFLNEARLAARLDHPNIVRIYDLGEINSHYYMSMEYLPGEDLRRIFKDTRGKELNIPCSTMAWITRSAAHALHFAHEMCDAQGKLVGLVHRDVSPSNIILTYLGEVKLVDFGIAKADAQISSTRPGTFKGKVSYVAPEQARGEPIDRRADVFALGVTLWEGLTLRRLFHGDSLASILAKIRDAEIPAPSRIRPDVPTKLDAVVLKAVERDKNTRFQTAEEFALALDEVLVEMGPPSVGPFLTSVFGQERGETLRQIARGHELEKNISKVFRLMSNSPPARSFTFPGGPRVGSQDDSGPKGGTPKPAAEEPRSPSSTLLPLQASDASPVHPVKPIPILSIVLGAALFFTAVTIWFSETSSDVAISPMPEAATLVVESEPPGAFVFIDGEPTGRMTPARITSLKLPGKYAIKVEKPGFRPSETVLSPSDGSVITRKFTLAPLSGILSFPNLPPDATLTIDSRPAPSRSTVELPAGTYEVRVEWRKQVKTKIVKSEPGKVIEVTFDF